MHLNKKTNPKKFWSLLNKLTVNDEKQNQHSNIKMSTWVKHFQELLSCENSNFGNPAMDIVGPLDFEITLEEVNLASKILKAGKSPGADSITNEMIICILKHFPTVLLSLFNSILHAGSHVPIWSLAVVVPIHKKGSTDNPSNFRGISLISCLAKLFYSILNNRLLQFCMDNKILTQNQLGFMPGNRTTDAHLVLHNLIQHLCHKNGKKMYACFVDFSKAFDRLPRDLLFEKLKSLGINGRFLAVLQNLYANDRTCIQSDGKISKEFPVNQGVRQGCVLSPLLFNIFMSGLSKNLEHENKITLYNDIAINSIFWADDLLLFSETEVGLNSILKQVDEYCSTNRMKINFDKTKCMVFNKTGRLLTSKCYIGEEKLENVRSYKYLGLIFTPSGEIKSALDDLRERALKAYMCMRDKLGTCFNTYLGDTIQLFDTLIKPILLYGSDFWGCLSLPKNNPIENLHLMFCKHLLGVQKYTTTNGVLLELGRIPLSIYAKTNAVKNWERIQREKANSLVLASSKNAEKEALEWINRIKYSLSENGFGYIHLQNDIKNAYKKLFTRQVDIFNQSAIINIANPDSKLRTYSLVKSTPGIANYLLNVSNSKYRQALSKLRLSNHELMIETGRHKGIPRIERCCLFCQNTAIEDEIHFLITCPTFNTLRNDILADFEIGIINHPFLSSKEKFVSLCGDPSLSLAKFTYKAFQLRKFLIQKPRTCI